MTIEEAFFKTFGIERSLDNWKQRADFLDVDKEVVASAVYPEITAEKLLELICILSGCCNCTLEFRTRNIEELKNGILQQAIERSFYALHKEKYKQQVKALFEEEQ